MDVFKWLCLVLVTLHYVHSEDIKRRLCMHIPINFTMSKFGCDFTLAEAKTYLQEGYCLHPCDVSIPNLGRGRYKLSDLVVKQGNHERWMSMSDICPSHYYNVNSKKNRYGVRKLSVECNSESTDYTHVLCKNDGDCVKNAECIRRGGIGVCVCKSNHIRIDGYCYDGNVPLGGFCSLSEQCTGSLHARICKDHRCICDSGYISHNQLCYPEAYFDDICFSSDKVCKDLMKECRIANNKDVGVCVCKSEYLGFGDRCLEGNLNVNDTCERSEQCSVATNSECQNGTCMCRDGSTVVNKTDCKQLEMDKNTAKTFLSREQAYAYGAIVGAAFGGIFLGALLTILVAYLAFRRYTAKMKKREETSVTFSRNSTHFAPITDGNHGQVLKNRKEKVQRKVVNVPPYATSKESPTYSNVQEAGKSHLKKDDVYSHLHEKEMNETDNVYDHASGTSCQIEDDYSHVNAGRSNDGIILPEDDEYAHTEEMISDNYFILENQK